MSLNLILIAASILLAAFSSPSDLSASPRLEGSERDHGHRNHDYDLSISTGDRDLRDCSDLRVRFGSREHSSSQETISFASSSQLKVRSSRHGGISLIGAASGALRVDICRFAVMEGGASADAALKSIVVNRSANELSAPGQSEDESDRVVFFIVHAPRGSSVELETKNGPLSVRSFDGKAILHAENGPISLRHTKGSIDATTTNGPISVDGGAGDVRARATNGPVSVKLDGLTWSGTGLDASTRNGPISLTLPEGYSSGVEVSSAGRSPVRCRAAACREVMTKYDDDSTSMNFGTGVTLVKLSTVNGPVSIKDKSSER